MFVESRMRSTETFSAKWNAPCGRAGREGIGGRESRVGSRESRVESGRSGCRDGRMNGKLLVQK